MKLLSSRRVLWTPHNRVPCHFMQSHISKIHAYLAVTCHLHFWQHDQGLLRATAVTRGWNGYRNKSQHRKLTLEKKILPPLLRVFSSVPLSFVLSWRENQSCFWKISFCAIINNHCDPGSWFVYVVTATDAFTCIGMRFLCCNTEIVLIPFYKQYISKSCCSVRSAKLPSSDWKENPSTCL